MQFKGCTGTIKAHGRSEISQMVQNRSNPLEIVSIAQDGCIKVWNCDSLALARSARIKTGYLTSLINYEQGFLVGTGKGELIKFTNELSVEWSTKIHTDCITDLLEAGEYLITASFDGRILFMSKPTMPIVAEINLEVPLLKMYKSGKWIFVSGNPSFKINTETLEATQLPRSEQIIEFGNKLLSCSDENGFSVLLEENDNTDYVPCQFILPFKNQLLAISEEQLGLISFSADDEIRFKCHKVSQLKKGYSIKAGVALEDAVFVGGEDGNIYKLECQVQEN